MQFHHSFQHSTRSSSHSNQTRKINERHTYQKGGNKTDIIHRWYDNVQRKSYSLNKNTTLSEKYSILYSEYYRTLKREIKEDTNKWKHIYYVLGLEELMPLKCHTMQSNL